MRATTMALSRLVEPLLLPLALALPRVLVLAQEQRAPPRDVHAPAQRHRNSSPKRALSSGGLMAVREAHLFCAS